MDTAPTTAGTSDTPDWIEISGRRPFRGLGLLALSVLFTLAVLIFFGAWFADGRIEARSDALGAQAEGEWWEDGLITVCPIH